MSTSIDGIDEKLAEWLERQPVYFVATAPSDDGGHLNCSPKGLDSFRVLGDREVAYLDYVGSGVETAAHLRENGRIVLMFCAFDGPPKIVRLHGTGRIVEPADPGFGSLLETFSPLAGVRGIVHVEVSRVSDSCGFGVPLMSYEGDRTQLHAWAERKGADGLAAYKREKNRRSIDGLPGLASVE